MFHKMLSLQMFLFELFVLETAVLCHIQLTIKYENNNQLNAKYAVHNLNF